MNLNFGSSKYNDEWHFKKGVLIAFFVFNGVSCVGEVMNHWIIHSCIVSWYIYIYIVMFWSLFSLEIKSSPGIFYGIWKTVVFIAFFVPLFYFFPYRVMPFLITWRTTVRNLTIPFNYHSHWWVPAFDLLLQELNDPD